MNHEEQRKFLIRQLLAELPGDIRKAEGCVAMPQDEEEQKRLLRSLMNIRPPRPVSPGFLEVQNAYLGEEVRRKGITDGDTLPVSSRNRRMVLWKGDITTLKADGIVNAANSALRGCFVPCHTCVDNMIHSVSGIQLRLACDEIMKGQGYEEPAGRAKITPAYNLPCRFVLHTVGPVVHGALTKEHCRQLEDCYNSCLRLASRNRLRSLAFCCISTGEFRFPREKAAEIAVRTTEEFLKTDRQIERVIFNVFKQEDCRIYSGLLEQR